jgi:hypothetical protein
LSPAEKVINSIRFARFRQFAFRDFRLALESSSLGILMPFALVPDGLFAVMLQLSLFERRLVAPSDYPETVHAN